MLQSALIAAPDEALGRRNHAGECAVANDRHSGDRTGAAVVHRRHRARADSGRMTFPYIIPGRVMSGVAMAAGDERHAVYFLGGGSPHLPLRDSRRRHAGRHCASKLAPS